MNDSADQWHAELNLSGVQAGEYTLNAEAPAAQTSKQVEIVEPATPAEQFPTSAPIETTEGSAQNQDQNAVTVASTETPEPQLLDLDFQTALQFSVGLLATVVVISGVVLIRTRR